MFPVPKGGVNIEVKGLKELQKKLGKVADEIIYEADLLFEVAANQYANLAIGDAPVDQGLLRQLISSKKIKVLRYQVVSGAEWSAWIEWGTRSRVQVPADLQAYAAQFKGGQSGGDPKQKIFDWCKRVGIPKEAWYPVFIKIMTVGINPHPFFFKHRQPVFNQLLKDLKPAIRRALKK